MPNSLDTRWRKLESYSWQRGPILLTVTQDPRREHPVLWNVEVTASTIPPGHIPVGEPPTLTRTASGHAGDFDTAELAARRAALLLWLLLALETGVEPDGFDGDEEWITSLKEALDHERPWWGILTP